LLVRRGGSPGLWQGDSPAGFAQAPSGPQDARRRGGRHRTLEFSAHAGGSQNRPGFGGGLHRGAEAGQPDTTQRRIVCGVRPGCSAAKECLPGVAGSAVEIGAEFLENPICRKITFTGSTEVGKKLIAGAAAQVKSLSLELGGLAPLIVFEDADLERTVEGIMVAKFRNTGQSCIAANRVLVQKPVYEAVLERLLPKVRALKAGDGLEAGVQIGPLVNQAGVAKALEHVTDAVARGARLLCGGKPLSGRGYFFEATLLADVPRASLCLSQETFAPVLPMLSFETEAEAIEMANSTPFGLSAYAFTRDIARVFRLGETLEAGIIGINDGLPTVSHAPFGGVKQSGWGRELGQEGMEAFLDAKHVSLNL